MYTTILAALAAVAAAAPAPQASSSPYAPLRFGGIALRSASDIHLRPVNANSGAFWLAKPDSDKQTSASTPDVEGIDPSNYQTNQTIFSYTNNGQEQLALSVAVPGGQQVYVTEGDEEEGILAGQLRFTTPHSVATEGPALYQGFCITPDSFLQFEGKDWFACPIENDQSWGIWSVARVAGSNAGGNCLPFTFRVAQVGEETKNAWEYN